MLAVLTESLLLNRYTVDRKGEFCREHLTPFNRQSDAHGSACFADCTTGPRFQPVARTEMVSRRSMTDGVVVVAVSVEGVASPAGMAAGASTVASSGAPAAIYGQDADF